MSSTGSEIPPTGVGKAERSANRVRIRVADRSRPASRKMGQTGQTRRLADGERAFNLDRLLADPPRVHPSAPQGVWLTDRDCYEFLQGVLSPGMRTLETGLGVSTVVFLLAGAVHTAVFLDPAEGEILLTYCHERSLSTDELSLFPGGSDVVLPTLERTPLDAVLVDGLHSFPFPQLDWLYAASRLRRGGILVIDDIQLPAPLQLACFLDADARWRTLGRTDKWVAYVRESEGTLNEEWFQQPFFGSPGYQLRSLRRTLQPKVAEVSGRAARKLRPGRAARKLRRLTSRKKAS